MTYQCPMPGCQKNARAKLYCKRSDCGSAPKDREAVSDTTEAVRKALWIAAGVTDAQAAQDAIAAYLAALDAADWRVVPKEPTGAMWSAGRSRFSVHAERYRQQTTTRAADAHADTAPDDIYCAMLAAAPKAPR